MILQDILPSIISRIEIRFKEMAVISTNDGTALTSNGSYIEADISDVNFSIKNSVTTASDFIKMLQEAGTASNRYPFIFIDSEQVSYNGNVVTIGSLVVATLTDKSYSDRERDALVVRPILLNLVELLKESISCFCAVDYPFDPQMIIHYNGELQFPEYVDAIQLKNLEFRIIKTF